MTQTLRFERMMDGPDALPIGTPRGPVLPYMGGTVIDATEHGTSYERELYNARVRPHLHDERDREAAESLRAAMVATVPGSPVDRCCHTCRHAIITASAAHPCPYCGSHRLSEPV